MNIRIWLSALLPLAMVSCNGIFGGIYDDPIPAEDSRYGFIAEDDDGLGGTLYLDLRAYDRWTYIDFLGRNVDTANITLGQSAPLSWDIALHRYDAATHNGEAAESTITDIDLLPVDWTAEGLAFEADVDSHVVVDMSQMMDGILAYDSAKVNPVLSRWMDVDLSTMPPIYTLSERVYAVRLVDGTMIALQFTNYTNEASTKGYATIRYRVFTKTTNAPQ